MFEFSSVYRRTLVVRPHIMKVKVVPVHTVSGGEVIAFLNLGTGLSWLVIFTWLIISARQKALSVIHWITGVVGPRASKVAMEKRKILALWLSNWQPSHYTSRNNGVLTELFFLRVTLFYCPKIHNHLLLLLDCIFLYESFLYVITSTLLFALVLSSHLQQNIPNGLFL